MQNEPEDFLSMEGKKIPRRLSVDYISFAAHVDYSQNSKFIDDVKPAHLVLVHGEQNNANRLRAALKKHFADKKEDIQIYTPQNIEVLKIRLTRNRIARVRALFFFFSTSFHGADLEVTCSNRLWVRWPRQLQSKDRLCRHYSSPRTLNTRYFSRLISKSSLDCQRARSLSDKGLLSVSVGT
jgi:hypothetical protein